ncbi:hypothetical protein [Algoriphagus confluentis]|uniref:META domain-containing protein n=1 Tax=Algoriphagus confluentis TaxID=1697556 RepID=A0ABQ6PLZ5_9BACT|nr:hypothetical protein Aconfl_16210 [Algoriphagus confluentis]
MKSFLSILILSGFFLSCISEESPSRTDENLVQNLSTGVWEISLFEVDKINRSAEFEGIGFSFFPNGQVEALRGTQLLGQGAWSSGTNSGRVEVRLAFPNTPPFSMLNADWYQVFIQNDRIQLRNSSPESDNFLILKKQ